MLSRSNLLKWDPIFLNRIEVVSDRQFHQSPEPMHIKRFLCERCAVTCTKNRGIFFEWPFLFMGIKCHDGTFFTYGEISKPYIRNLSREGRWKWSRWNLDPSQNGREAQHNARNKQNLSVEISDIGARMVDGNADSVSPSLAFHIPSLLLQPVFTPARKLKRLDQQFWLRLGASRSFSAHLNSFIRSVGHLSNF